jgi:hypothetical protein
MAGKQKRLTRRVAAPPPQGGLPLSASHVFTVILEDDEEVQWIWTHGLQGSYISGYRIVKDDWLGSPLRGA